MEHIFWLAAVGFIFLAIYNRRTKKMYTQNISGYQFLMLTLTWGGFAVLITYWMLTLAGLDTSVRAQQAGE